MIEFQDVAIGYSDPPLLKNLNFSIAKGDLLGLFGPNGSGKSTLIRSILGTVPILNGNIQLLPALRFGYVPQQGTANLLFPLSVEEVVTMGLYGSRRPFLKVRKKEKEQVKQVLDEVGFSAKANESFRLLSGGEKQKTMIARALVAHPDVIVLDEPTNGLDLVSQKKLLSMVHSICQEKKITLILVSHQINETLPFVQRIGLIAQQQMVLGDVADVLTSQKVKNLLGASVSVHKSGDTFRLEVGGCP